MFVQNEQLGQPFGALFAAVTLEWGEGGEGGLDPGGGGGGGVARHFQN